MDMNDLITKTKKTSLRFPVQYDRNEIFMDMMEEAGELAQAMLITSKRKTTNDSSKQKTVEDIADALCDTLYNIFLLADAYHLDLPREYEQMLARLNVRLDNGEFHDKQDN